MIRFYLFTIIFFISSFKIFLLPDTPNFEIKVSSKNLKLYQTFQIDIFLPEASYVYLFEIRNNKKAYLLFPNKYYRSAKLKKGNTKIPNEKKRFELYTSPPYGKSTLFALYSIKKLDLLHNKLYYKKPVFKFDSLSVSKTEIDSFFSSSPDTHYKLSNEINLNIKK